jgi:flagellar basal-body rod protein FlgB
VNGLGRYDTTTMLEKALPVVESSHRVLANNIANANTPGFVPTHVSFQESLRQSLAAAGPRMSLETTNPGHISSSGSFPSLVLEADTFEPGRNDQSKFNVEREMVELLKNNGRFNILSGILTKRYQQVREVLRIT